MNFQTDKTTSSSPEYRLCSPVSSGSSKILQVWYACDPISLNAKHGHPKTGHIMSPIPKRSDSFLYNTNSASNASVEYVSVVWVIATMHSKSKVTK